MLTDEEENEDDKDAPRRDVVVVIIIVAIIDDAAVVIVFFFCETTRRERISLRRVLSLSLRVWFRNEVFPHLVSVSIKKARAEGNNSRTSQKEE